MPTPDYIRGWSSALSEAARQLDAAGWGVPERHLRALDRYKVRVANEDDIRLAIGKGDSLGAAVARAYLALGRAG